MSVYDPEAFAERVQLAARVIAEGRPTSRRFDTCCEMGDGDEVAVMVYRRSLNNPKIAANIWRYFSRAAVMAAVDRLTDIPSRSMAKQAARARDKQKKAFGEFMARQSQKGAETTS